MAGWTITDVILYEVDEKDHRDRCPLSQATRDILLAIELDRVGAPVVTVRINPDSKSFKKKKA